MLLCLTPNTGLSMTGKTRLDKERLALAQAEMVATRHKALFYIYHIFIGDNRITGQEMEAFDNPSISEGEVQGSTRLP